MIEKKHGPKPNQVDVWEWVFVNTKLSLYSSIAIFNSMVTCHLILQKSQGDIKPAT